MSDNTGTKKISEDNVSNIKTGLLNLILVRTREAVVECPLGILFLYMSAFPVVLWCNG